MRKSLGAAALLALLVVPLTGSAGATLTKPTPPKKGQEVCVGVLVATAVSAGTVAVADAHALDEQISANLSIMAPANADVTARICVVVDPSVALKIGTKGLVNVSVGKNGGVFIVAKADLQTLVDAGNVNVSVDVCAKANASASLEGGAAVNDPDPKEDTSDEPIGSDLPIEECISFDAKKEIAALSDLTDKELTRFEVMLPKK